MKKLPRVTALFIAAAVASAGCSAEEGTEEVTDTASAAIRVRPLEVGWVLSDATCESLVVFANWPAPVPGQATIRFIVADKKSATAILNFDVDPGDTTINQALTNLIFPLAANGKHRFEFRAELLDAQGETLRSAKTGAALACTFPVGSGG